MGMYVSLYLGPYMVVTGEKPTEVDKRIKTCSNVNCEKHKANKEMSSAFCSSCGSVVGKKEYKETEKTPPFWMLDDIEEFVDELCETTRDGRKDDKQIFVPNEKIPFQPERHLDDDYFDMNLLNINHTEEIEWFKKRYEKIISFFKSELGEDSVEFRWGIVQWYS